MSTATGSAAVHARLDHPVVDGDGHWLEPIPVFEEHLDAVGGAKAVDAWRRFARARHELYGLSTAERGRRRTPRNLWWGTTNDARDRATALAPGLLYERLGDFGIDFAIVYPSMALTLPVLADDELRHWSLRAYNIMTAEMFAPYRDRLTPAAVIGNATPQEALEELEFAVGTLGMKVAMLGLTAVRPIEADAAWQPEVAKRRHYVDTLALDSPYDYDPVWRRLVELKVALTVHGGSKAWSDRLSTSSHTSNHLGHFAQGNHLAARTAFLGGLTHRFPELNVAFLEGGVGWACNLYYDLVGHWQKLNRTAMHRHLRPDRLDAGEVRRLLESYGDDRLRRNLDALVKDNLDPFDPYITLEESTRRNLDADEFRNVPISSPADIERLFVEPFYFGAESDDPVTAWAFDKRMKARLKPVFSSDISHFDVTDMTEVLEEAYELVEDGLLDLEDFRAFTFTNAVKLHTKLNPDFFRGTAVEKAVVDILAA
jgi:predicted TIM-barrel fold metal-dependent hydrolase